MLWLGNDFAACERCFVNRGDDEAVRARASDNAAAAAVKYCIDDAAVVVIVAGIIDLRYEVDFERLILSGRCMYVYMCTAEKR